VGNGGALACLGGKSEILAPLSMVTYEMPSGTGSLDLQIEFMGIKEWACVPSKLGLTPKEIEKRLNCTVVINVTYSLTHVAVEDQLGEARKPVNVIDNYELLQALIGSFAAHPVSVRLKLLGAVISGTCL